jgi:hypothetical protein
VIRLAQAGTEPGAEQLSSLLSQLNAFSAGSTTVRPPSPKEAMAIYSVAVRLVRMQLTMGAQDHLAPADVAVTRDVLMGTRQLLRAALDRLERVTPSQLVVIDGGAGES